MSNLQTKAQGYDPLPIQTTRQMTGSHVAEWCNWNLKFSVLNKMVHPLQEGVGKAKKI